MAEELKQPRHRDQVLQTLQARRKRLAETLAAIDKAIETLSTSEEAGLVLDLLQAAGIR